MESSNQNYELFLQEIEGVDDYWGPTFRFVFFFFKFIHNVLIGSTQE